MIDTSKSKRIQWTTLSKQSTVKIDQVRMIRGNILTLFVDGVDGQNEDPFGISNQVQIEIRIMPNGLIEIFHDADTPESVTLETFDKYPYGLTYDEVASGNRDKYVGDRDNE